MGDTEFEEFRKHFEELPQHVRAPSYSYKLVHAITPLEENKSFLEKVELGEKLCGIRENESFITERQQESVGQCTQKMNQIILRRNDISNYSRSLRESENNIEIISADDRERIIETQRTLMGREQVEDGRCRTKNKRRRKLPQIPKHKKPLEGVKQASLFEELNAAQAGDSFISQSTGCLISENLDISAKTKDVLTSIAEQGEVAPLPPSLILNLVNLENIEEGLVGDADSGNSTSHSPESEQLRQISHREGEGYDRGV